MLNSSNKMPRDTHFNALDAVKVVTLSNEGRRQKDIGEIVGMNQSTVSRILKRHRETGEYKRRPGQGRRRCTTEVDDRYLQLQALRNRGLTAPELKNMLQNTRHVNVSNRTVRRRLKERNLTPKRPAIVPRLLPRHKIQRLHFARNHVNWTVDQWRNVLFSDETRVQLWKPDGRKRVYRRPGERYAACNLVQNVSFGGGSIMLWGGISWEGRTELVEIDIRMNGEYYINTILQEHVLPYIGFVGYDRFLLMHDNARAHAANIVAQYLNDVHITQLDWPPLSADLNPIEHLWDLLKRRIRARNPGPSTLLELRNALQEEWNNIPQEDIQNLIRSMPRRMEAVIRARGGNTRY